MRSFAAMPFMLQSSSNAASLRGAGNPGSFASQDRNTSMAPSIATDSMACPQQPL